MMLPIMSHAVEVHEVREDVPKKAAVPLDFVQMRGGGALPKLFGTF